MNRSSVHLQTSQSLPANHKKTQWFDCRLSVPLWSEIMMWLKTQDATLVPYIWNITDVTVTSLNCYWLYWWCIISVTKYVHSGHNYNRLNKEVTKVFVIAVNPMDWLATVFNILLFSVEKNSKGKYSIEQLSYFPFAETAHDGQTSCLKNRCWVVWYVWGVALRLGNPQVLHSKPSIGQFFHNFKNSSTLSHFFFKAKK